MNLFFKKPTFPEGANDTKQELLLELLGYLRYGSNEMQLAAAGRLFGMGLVTHTPASRSLKVESIGEFSVEAFCKRLSNNPFEDVAIRDAADACLSKWNAPITLLRAAEQPDDLKDILLRPTSGPGENNPDLLLRPVEEE